MIKILILGGTRFLGCDFVNSLNPASFEIHIASRRDPGRIPYYQFDRKCQEDLVKLISHHNFDVIIDFIAYSSPDAEKLIHAIHRKNAYNPYLIIISSTYVYGNPLHLEARKEYSEESFNPSVYAYSSLDRPDVDYFVGKRSMESYVVNHYDNYALLRLPVILGAHDYTGKTTYFSNLVRNKQKIFFNHEYGASNFIFSKEASDVLQQIIANRFKGIINCCLNDTLNQLDILSMYCDFFKVPVNQILDSQAPIVKSPFYYSKDFIINNKKQSLLCDLNIPFEEALQRELRQMVN